MRDDDDLDREIRSHLELEEEELVAGGLSREAARAAARQQFGNVTRVKEVVHDMRPFALLDQLAQDLKLAVRRLRMAPGVTVLTVLTLAIGIAASTTVFSAADAILWHPLPFRDPSRLVGLWGYDPATKTTGRLVSLDVLDGWTTKDQVLDGAYAYDQIGTVLTGDGAAEAVSGGAVSRGLFRALGVHPAFGRDFVPDDFLPHAPAVAIVSDRLWRDRLAGSRDVIGRSIVLNDVPHTIVGVMPPGFTFPFAYDRFWVPLVRDRRRSAYAFALGILRPGITLAHAQRFAETATRHVADPSVRTQREIRIRPFMFRDRRTVQALVALLAAVGLLLLIAIANAANVRLAQAVHRDAEMAVRASLGATTFRLGRQVVTEAVLASLLATGVALLSGAWAIRTLVAVVPAALTAESLRPIALDWRAFTFAAAAAIVTSIGIAWLPVLRAGRADVMSAVKGIAAVGRSHARSRHGLLIVQLAITLVLLVAAGLLGTGFLRLLENDPGFAADRILAADVVLPMSRYPEKADARRFFDRLRRRAAALPGVEAATVSASIPPHLGFRTDTVETLDRGIATGTSVLVAQGYVDDGFFATLGIPLIRGRAFEASDDASGPKVAIIGRGLARRLWPDGSAIGRRFRWSPDQPWWTVVGVVGDVRNGGFQQPLGDSAIYYPRAQEDRPWNYQSLVVRTAGPPASLGPSIRELVSQMDPDVPIVHLHTADEAIAESNARVRFATILMIAFAVVALTLALVGIYGAFWYAVSERTREMGIRVALGATPRDIVSLVLATSIRLAIAGLALGLVTALAAAQTLRSLLFEISPTDPAVLSAVTLGFLAAIVLASYLPARRASRTNPVDALRNV